MSDSLLAACAVAKLAGGSTRQRGILVLAVGFMVCEMAPRPLTTTKLEIPKYVRILKNAPRLGGVVDFVANPTEALLYQTRHQRPMAFGYISRLPASVEKKDDLLARDLLAGRVPLLCNRGFRFLVVDSQKHTGLFEADVVFADRRATLLELDCDGESARAVRR